MTDGGYFFEYMRLLLGDRYDSFVSAYNDKPRHKALRANTLKITPDELNSLLGGNLKRNPLSDCTFY